MKKLIFSAMITAAVMIGCTKNTVVDQEKDPVEIKLTSGVVVSKTALDNNSTVSGLVFHRTDYTALPADCSGTSISTGTRATDGKIVFDAPEYYHPTLPTAIVSYYPEGRIIPNPAVPGKELVAININGRTDVLYCPITGLTGTAENPQPTSIVYSHVLALIEIVCKAEAGKDAEVQGRWGQVLEIQVRKTMPEVAVDLGPSATVTYVGTPTNKQMWDASFKGFKPITLVSNNSTVEARGMFAPPVGGLLELVVTTMREGAAPTDKNLKITLPGNAEFKAGFTHKIELTFMGTPDEPEIIVTSTIAPWKAGANGSGNVN